MTVPGVLVRFECGQEDRISVECGPFPFLQVTYNELRIGPEGETLATFNAETHEWRVLNQEAWYSDVLIYPVEAKE